MDRPGPSVPAHEVNPADSSDARERRRRNRRRGTRTTAQPAESRQQPLPADPANVEPQRPMPAAPAPRGRRGGSRARQAGPPALRCVRAVVEIPVEWPVASRRGVATAAVVEVDRRGEERLLCDCLHDGPHFWPDVEPAAPIWDAELDASLAGEDEDA